MQKSLQGLMQNLLSMIARTDFQLARTLFQEKTHELEPWTLQELCNVFRRFPETVAAHKFCFFINGLDEYYGQEEDAILFVEQLAACPFIKVCASSRPWNRFREAFGTPSHTLCWKISPGWISLTMSSRSCSRTRRCSAVWHLTSGASSLVNRWRDEPKVSSFGSF